MNPSQLELANAILTGVKILSEANALASELAVDSFEGSKTWTEAAREAAR